MIRALIPTALLGVLILLPWGEVRAQAPPQAPPAAEPDTFQLVFDREVFNYPAYQRRNPFRPLTGNDAGPRYEEVRLLGVVLSPDGGSVALLGPRAGSGRSASPSRTFRVREGEILGNMRIMAIHRRELVVQVDEFGIVETRVLELRRTEPEAQAGQEDDEVLDAPVDDPTTGPPATDTIPASPQSGELQGPVADPDTTRPPANGNGGSV